MRNNRNQGTPKILIRDQWFPARRDKLSAIERHRRAGAVPCNLSPVTSFRAAQRRGMILLLVIALLVLLALMGTVFILMASADRKSAYASNSSASLNMAQQGVLNTVRGLMLSGTLDENGQTLAIGTYTTTTGFMPDHYVSPALPGQIARFWDYPEVGAMPVGSTQAQFYQTAIAAGASVTAPAQYAPSEPWLVSNQPYEPGNNYIPGEEVFYYTAAGTRWVYVGPPNSATAPGAPSSTNTTYWMLATTPTVGYAGASGTTTTTIPLLTTLSPYLYDPGPTGTYGGTTYTGGSYDIPWQVGGAGPYPVSVPNAAVVEPRWAFYSTNNPPLTSSGTLDAMWNLLPYSDPNGTRYRFATRIIDMSSQLNLNTGWIANAYTSVGSNNAEATDPYGIYGAFVGSAPIMNVGGLNIYPTDLANAATQGTPVQIGSGTTPGRTGVYATYKSGGVYGAFYTLPVWQSALSEYELQFPSSGPPSYTYPTTPPAAFTASLFGTNSAMDLLTGAGAGGVVFGSPYFSRVATLMPNTLGLEANYFGSGYRSLYTTYSFGRDVAPINPGTASTGTAPPKVNLNASVTNATQLTALADNLYTTMVASGYNAQHAREFLANYFTYRFDAGGYGGSPAYLAAGNLLTVPMGGSTITALLPVATVPPGLACMGTTAQPFLNEVEVELTAKANKTTVTDWAVEVVNPFPNAAAGSLPCSNYSISITGVGTISLTGASLGGSTSTGDKMFGVLAYQKGSLKAQASGDGFIITSANVPTRGGTIVVNLIRNAVAGGGGSVTVDSMSIVVPAAIPNNSSRYYDVAKDNAGTSDGIWGCDSSASQTTNSDTPIGTIGTNNGLVATTGEPGVILYDRWYSGDQVAPGATAGTNLANINDLNCIARECTTSTETLPQQIDTNIAAAGPHTAYVPPANLGMYYVAQAQAAADPVIPAISPAISPEVSESALYFDFAYDPRAAYTAANAGFGDPETTILGEIPPTFLSCTTLTDRSQSNTTAAIALPEGATDLVRQAGKININTAGSDVLYSAFSEDGALWKTTATPPAPPNIYQLVADAIGFRDRLTSPTPVAGTGLTVPAGYAGKGYSTFGGIGFHSAADLLVAFLPTTEIAGGLYTGSVAPTTIQQRDAAWADVENFLTVRSDTFAVYGLVQALRLNPAYTTGGGGAYTPGTYLPTDWYNANQGILVGTGGTYNEGSISTDPTNQNAEFILEGSRRFIAIVDRSYCNNGATVQPHIVALKILPQ